MTHNTFPALRIIRQPDGFTLIEILMVTALLAILSATIFGAWSGVVRAKDAIDNERVTARGAQYVLTRIMRELAGYALEPLETPPQAGSSDPVTLGSTPGNNVSYLIGTNKATEKGGSDSIRFVSSSAGQALLGTFANFGLVEIEYRLEKPKETMPSAETLGDDEYVLVREEKPGSVSNTDLLEKKRFTFPVAEHVTSLNFRYFDGALWKDSWDETTKNVPEAVEISLAFKTPSGLINTYRTAVGLFRREPGS